MKHQISDLYQMQSLPLDIKIIMTQRRLLDWYNHYDGLTYLGYSGGKDSTCLMHIIRSIPYLSDIPAVYVDTGLEYPEIRDFVRSFGNVTILRP
ncbi:MAG: phosphoadenosine phosphosulfate reductase family protein, partial [Acutalibacteraceae bacterium]|nr:phosphoadenosine phosphosulfate reductase family protein [Acutalibacteraceae bacterium]